MNPAVLFTHPIELPTGIGQLLLMLPLLAAVATVYKTLRTKSLRRLPLEVSWLMAYMVGGLIVLGLVLCVVHEFWPF